MELFQQLLSLAQSGGAVAAPIFAILWWLERGERLDDRQLNEERSQRRDAALVEVRLALTTLAAIFNSRPSGGTQA